MRQKCSFILKASTALLLALLMLFGTVATSLAAVVEDADTAAQAEDIADTGADVDDLAETGWTDVYLIGDLFGDWSTGKKLGNGNFTSSGMYYFNKGDYFAVKIGGTQYGPSTNNSNFVVSGCRADTSGNAFKFNGTSGWYKVGVDQETGDNDKKPWLWLESQTDPTRTVAGDENLTGSNWSTSDDPMTFDTSIDKFKWTSDPITTAGSYSFKVTDGSWSNSWPNDNYAVNDIPAGARVVVTCDYYNSNTVAAYIEYKITVATATGGSATTSPSGYAKSGTEVTVTSTPSTGYNAGTPTVKDSDNSAVTVTSNKFTMPSKNVTVTPKFTLKTYTVSYNKGTNGTGTNTSDTKTHGTALTLKGAIFTRTGYTQTAWNTNSAGTGGTSYALSGSYTANSAVTLYPTWTAKQTTLSFNTNGATSNGTQTVSGSAIYDTDMPSFTTYTKPTKTGYSLDGWYSEETGGTKYYNEDGSSAAQWKIDAATATLYAHWSEVKAGATVKAYTDNFASGTGGTVKVGDDGTPGATATISNDTFGIDTASPAIIRATTETGYTFTGWETGGTYGSNVKLYTDSACTTLYDKTTHGGNYSTVYAKTDGTSGMTTSNTEIRAMFESVKHTITYSGEYTGDGSHFTDLTGAVTAKYYEAATEAPTEAPTSGSGGSGAGYYMWYNTNNSKSLDTASSAGQMIDLGNGTCYASFTCVAGMNYDVVINSNSTKGSCLNSSTTVTGNQTWAKVENNGDTYWALDSYIAAVPIYVIYNPTANSVNFTTTNPAGSGGSGGSSGSGESGSGTGTTGSGTAFDSGDSIAYGKVAEFTAEPTMTVSGDTYTFAEWVDGSGNKLSSENPYKIKITADKTVKARYYKVYKLSAFDSYSFDQINVTFVTAPPKIITVKHGEDIYIYSYDGTASTGNPDSPPDDTASDMADALAIGSGPYGQGNYIQYYAGDEITLYYSAMASSEIFKGVFYNNSVNYYVAAPDRNSFISHDYSAGNTLYMNSAYYTAEQIGNKTFSGVTVDYNVHSIKFTGTQDYKNIDVETATKRKVYFSDYTNAVIGSKNTDNYYYDGEALSETGNQLTVKAAGSATQTNSITASNVKFYRADANGQKTGSELSGFTVTYDSGSDAVTNSGTTASTRYIIISGNMPSYDLYIDLNMTSNYTLKLGSKVMYDPMENPAKTRLAEVATVTIKEGSTTKLTAPNDADVTSSPTSVTTGTALTLTSAFTGSWGNYYMFVGWYWGSDTAPDFEKGFISDKLTLSYAPKKGGTIWAVGTRGLYINGSKYITGKDTDWYSENNTWKNLPMSFDGKSGRYYWEITDTMFATAGSNYKTWSGTGNEYYKGNDDNFYWYSSDNSEHGNAFFQLLDSATGYDSKTLWSGITSYKVDTPANGPTYGKIYPEGDNLDTKKKDGQGFINFNETDYAGQSSPLRIYFDPSKTGTDRLTVESTKIYSNLYVSNGFDVGSTSRTSFVTVEPVVDGVVKTSGQIGYFSVGKQGDGWDPDIEGHVNHFKPQKKGATVRITKTAGGSDKIVAFFIYDITNKTVRAERDVKNSSNNYYIDLTLANEEQNLYIVPIVEEAGANVTITFDATQLNRKQWGDIVTAYAWYQNNGGNALGGYPGQPMIPSDDMTTWTTTFKGEKSSNELEGITFSNYVDGNHSWLGCSGVMSTVTYGGGGKAADPTTVSFGNDGIIKQYNYIESGNGKEYSRGNFKAQTYDYREPIALYDRFKNVQDANGQVSISFSMKDGNSSLISWTHNDLLTHNIVTLEPDPNWGTLNWEYLTNAKGDKYIDMNGNTMKTKPTASFYVAAKGQVLYNNSSMTHVFYSGKDYDTVSGVTYGGASGIGMNYAVQWYVYDASGNYITNVLTAGIADLSSNNVDSYIGKKLEDMGYAVDGKSVAICYDKPRYMYGDSNTAGSGEAAGYNGKGINCGSNFDAYRFTGQWNAVASTDTVSVNVRVGMMTDSGEKLADSNTAGYGNASATYDIDKGNNTPVTDADGNHAPSQADNKSSVRTSVRDAANSPVKLNASAQNFIGWYYYDANTGDFVKANYESNENFYPNYSNKDVTFYAMYRASAIYQYKYTGREGARTYSAAGNDLTEYELANNSVIVPESHQADIISKLPVGIGVFKKNIDFSGSSYDSWTKTPDDKGYILDITGFVQTTPEYTLTIHFKYDNGSTVEDVTVTDKAVYNGKAIDLTDGTYTFTPESGGLVTKFAGTAITSYYNKPFRGWYTYVNGQAGELISTQRNYGLRLTGNQDIIAVYDESGSPNISEGWHVDIDENVLNKELTTSTTGVFYNDTIVRVRNGADVRAELPTDSKIGVLVVCDNKTNETINGYNTTQLGTLVGAVANGKTMKTAKGLSITNMQATSQTGFNRSDIAVRSTYEKNFGSKYCVYAYFYDGSAYHFSYPSAVNTYE